MSKISEQERREAIERLREWVKPGDTVFTILRHVSKSGMMRVIDAVVFAPDGSPIHLAWNIAKAVGYPIDRDREGVKVNGCGMDMGFDVVYNLGRALWPDGVGCVGEKCRSNDHSNGDRDYTPNTDHKHWHDDSGYALTQRWL